MDYYIPSKRAKRNLLIKLVAISAIVITSFFYSKNLAFDSLQLMKTDHELGQQGILNSLLIHATVITIVFYLLVFNRLSLALKAYRKNVWPPEGVELGKKVPIKLGKAAKEYSIRFALLSILFLLLPIKWQYQAYSYYQQIKVFNSIDLKLKQLEQKLIDCEPNKKINKDT